MKPALPPPGTVRVWFLRAGSRPEDPSFKGDQWVLSAEEGVRARRFRDLESQERFVTSRVHLRWLLGRCLELNPSEVPIVAGPGGKPLLDPAFTARPPLHFNVAHSGPFVALALATSGPVGVDIEMMRPLPGLAELAARVLSAGELRVLEMLPARIRSEAFFAAWTRKEAVLKAMGTGLGFPLDQIEVGTGPGATIVEVPDDGGGAANPWTVMSFPLSPRGSKGAVALAGGLLELHVEPVVPGTSDRGILLR
jgi:4'-phosphopantetheinyl transferase